MTGYCTAKNNSTTWVRGCRGTSWKTWGRNAKYSRTNTVKDKVHGKTKYSRTNRVKKNSWQFCFKMLYNVFDFLFENRPLNKMYNVFSSCYSMQSPSLALFKLWHWRFVLCEISRNEKCSLLQYQTPRSLLKNKAIAEKIEMKLGLIYGLH